MRCTRPPSWSIRIGRVGAPDGLAQRRGQRRHLRRRLDVAPEEDEAPRRRGTEERFLLGA